MAVVGRGDEQAGAGFPAAIGETPANALDMQEKVAIGQRTVLGHQTWLLCRCARNTVDPVHPPEIPRSPRPPNRATPCMRSCRGSARSFDEEAIGGARTVAGSSPAVLPVQPFPSSARLGTTNAAIFKYGHAAAAAMRVASVCVSVRRSHAEVAER